jgi:hypothetical protein
MKLRISKYIILVLLNKRVMKKIISILALLLNSAVGYSQETINLKIIPFEFKNQNFYIENVFDNRQDMVLGLIEDRFGENVTLNFEYNTAATIKKFLDSSLAKTNNRSPINLRIHSLKIEQGQTSIEKITARAYLDLSFHTESGEELYKVSHYESQEFLLTELREINESHEQRIRAALEYCLWQFINAREAGTGDNLQKGGGIDQASFASEATSLEAFIPLAQWHDMVTYKRMTDRYNEAWNVSYTGFLDSEKDLIIPFSIGYGQSTAKSDIVKERGYNSASAFALGFGLNGFIKIIPGLYVDLGLNIPLGIEFLRDLENRKSKNVLIGIAAHQGIKIIPWEDFGIVIGAGIFQRWQTSMIEKRNFGFVLEVGINF